MSATWIITELGPDPGDGTVGGGEQFIWTADDQAAPEDGWKVPRRQNVVATKYPGGRKSVHQKLGPELLKQKHRGMWADRWMGEGAAIDTCDRFAAMVDRGNPVRIEHEGWSFVGTIEEFEPDRRDSSEIGYEFTFIPQYERPGTGPSAGVMRRAPAPEALLTPDQFYADSAVYVEQLTELQDDVRVWALASDYHHTAGQSLVLLVERATDVKAQLVAGSDTSGEAVKLSAQLATAYVSLAAAADAHLDETALLNNAEAVAWDDASNLLAFEDWRRNTDAASLLLLYQATVAARELRRRTQPSATKRARPFNGQHLYHFARIHNADWREIAARNHLDTMVLDGTMELIIPERAG